MFSWFFVGFPWFFVARARAWSRFAVYHDPPGCPRLRPARHRDTQPYGGEHKENPQRKDFRGVGGYLQGIVGNPSLVRIQGKTKEKPKRKNQTS